MSPIKETYDSQGFVVVPGLISSIDFPKLQEAADTIVNRTREGSWPHRRTVGKQFPPFDNDHPDSWGCQHVMHPDLGKPGVIFSHWYTSDALTRVCMQLCSVSEFLWWFHLGMRRATEMWRRRLAIRFVNQFRTFVSEMLTSL